MGKIILRLDRVMADRKMSLNELSARVGVSNVNLSKIKTGKDQRDPFLNIRGDLRGARLSAGRYLRISEG